MRKLPTGLLPVLFTEGNELNLQVEERSDTLIQSFGV